MAWFSWASLKHGGLLEPCQVDRFSPQPNWVEAWRWWLLELCGLHACANVVHVNVLPCCGTARLSNSPSPPFNFFSSFSSSTSYNSKLAIATPFSFFSLLLLLLLPLLFLGCRLPFFTLHALELNSSSSSTNINTSSYSLGDKTRRGKGRGREGRNKKRENK